ncbi:MAG: tripartite tricarboxylate transporter permease [Candidatus Hadarchaeales archaeon]
MTMLELIPFVLGGISLGIVTGLIPGLHVNNLAPMLAGLAAGASALSLELAVAIVAMSITNVFISYIPSTFLGAPEEGTELSVLPGHRFLLEGRGYRAVQLTALGCAGGLLASAFLLLPFLSVVGWAYGLMRPHMHLVLLAVIGVTVAMERSPRRIAWSCGIFLLSGMLGILTLDTGLMRGDLGLMPLLSGLFGLSVIAPGIIKGYTIPEQLIEDHGMGLGPAAKPVLVGTAAGAFTGIIPGIGPSQGTMLAQLVTGSGGNDDFLISVSSVNTSKALFSFVALYAIGRARSGAAVAVEKLVSVGFPELLLFVGVSMLAGGISGLLHLKLGRFMAKGIKNIPYRMLSLSVAAFIAIMTFIMTGPLGLLVLAVSTSIGMLPALVGVRRVHCMGVIVLPCILYFSGLKGGFMRFLGL